MNKVSVSYHAGMLIAMAGLLLACMPMPVLAAPDEWQGCAACHGQKAEGNPALDAPALAGQHAWYVLRQLEQFAEGTRGSHPDDGPGRQMQPFASTLDEAGRRRVAEFVAGLEPVSVAGSHAGNMMNGSRYYHGRCGSCHGGQAQGNEALQAPSLQGLTPEYLTRQMRYFQDGIRGSDRNDKYGRQMAMMANTVSDEEWNDILHFITEQQ